MRYMGKQGCVSCLFCVPTVLAAGHEATRALDTQVCLRLSRAEGSWFSSSARSCTRVKEAVIESLLTLKGHDHCRMLYFSISNCPPYQPPRNSAAVKGFKWLLKGQALEANRKSLTLTLPFIYCFDMRTSNFLTLVFKIGTMIWVFVWVWGGFNENSALEPLSQSLHTVSS